MKILITAGNTQSPIDRVRCITNIFTGKTGAAIAMEASRRGHQVTIATSHPETIHDDRIRVLPYRTYEDLESILSNELPGRLQYDAVIMAAAINDYHVAGAFDHEKKPVNQGKIRGHHPELWLKLIPAPKLIDRIRRDWGFTGTLVKFKLEVGLSDAELITIAEASRIHSQADWLVANTLEGKDDHAWIIGNQSKPEKVNRADLAKTIISRIDKIT